MLKAVLSNPRADLSYLFRNKSLLKQFCAYVNRLIRSLNFYILIFVLLYGQIDVARKILKDQDKFLRQIERRDHEY